jgi:hypothetical protein
MENSVPKASLREKLIDCRRHPFGKKLKVKRKNEKFMIPEQEHNGK